MVDLTLIRPSAKRTFRAVQCSLRLLQLFRSMSDHVLIGACSADRTSSLLQLHARASGAGGKQRQSPHVGEAGSLTAPAAGLAAGLMEEYRVRRLPVLDQQQRLVGIVSLSELSGRHLTTQLHWGVLQGAGACSASGQRRRVPAAIVHITDRHGREYVEAAAIRTFERDRGERPWRRAADGYEVVKPQ